MKDWIIVGIITLIISFTASYCSYYFEWGSVLDRTINYISMFTLPIILALWGYKYQIETQDRQILIKFCKRAVQKIDEHSIDTCQKYIENPDYDLTEDMNQSIRLMYNLLNNELLLFQIQNKSRRRLIKDVCSILNTMQVKKVDSTLTVDEASYLLNIAEDMSMIFSIVLWNNKKAVKKLKQYYKG